MSKKAFFKVCVFVFALSGCGSTASSGIVDAGAEAPSKTNPSVASNETMPDSQSTKTKKYKGPFKTFEPKSHSPRQRYRDWKAPDLGSMPKLKFRFDACFSNEESKKTNSPQQLLIGSGKRGGGGQGQAPKKTNRSQPSSGYLPSSPSESAPMPSAGRRDESVMTSEGAPSSEPERQKIADNKAPTDSGKKKDALEIAGDEAVSSVDDEPAGYNDWGAAIYLSNDDSMSLSSAQRVIYAIDNFLPLPLNEIRPHELLNYFAFNTTPVEQGDDFSVYAELDKDTREEGIYTLALSVNGRPESRDSRRNAAITLVIDRSGSMSDEGRMNYLKRGLNRMLDELKTGDMVHTVIFDHEVCVPIENFVVGRDDMGKLRKVINALEPRGSTDLHRGLSLGYEIADKSYQTQANNRVVLITDALTNTGVTDEEMIAMISKYYETRRIRLSGVGVGREFNDSLLDRLTERGKGAYVFLGSEAEVDAVFGGRFISLIETTALDVHFRLHLPPSLRMNVFYGEESSTVKEDVQEIHYFASTSQLFLSDLMARGGVLRPQDGVMLTIEYKDPETEEELVEEYAFVLRDIMKRTANVKKARLIMTWIDMLTYMAQRPIPEQYFGRAAAWSDPDGYEKCQNGSLEFKRLAEGISNDPEVARVLNLWEKHCSRYERPRNPIKRTVTPTQDRWPGAQDNNRQ